MDPKGPDLFFHYHPAKDISTVISLLDLTAP
jgi:hypothetical protein